MLMQHILLAMQIIWSLVALLLATPAFAQPFFFSEPTPLTTTRYAPDAGSGRLVTNGVAPYLLWVRDGKVRLTLVQDVPTAGRPVLDGAAADAVWTGSHFLVVAFQAPSFYVARRVAADGEPLSAPFTIVSDAPPSEPRLAFDGARVLLAYGLTPVRTLLLARDGTPAGEPRVAPLESAATDLAVTARGGELLLAAAAHRNISMATLHADDSWTRHDRAAAAILPREIATAASERDQLTIWTNGSGPLHASFGPPGAAADFTLAGTNDAAHVAVTWDGQDYIYAYRLGSRIHVRYFNAAFPFASVEASLSSTVDLVSVNGRSYVVFHANGAGLPMLVRDVLALSSGETGAWSARAQTLQSTASSATSALTVWFEGNRELRAGVRTADGAWYERQFPNTDQAAPLAASDGHGFAVVQATPVQGWTATLIDGQANFTAIAPRVTSFHPTGVAWAGDAYVVVGVDAAQRLVASRLTLSGTVTPPVILATPRTGRKLEWGRVAARDGELLVIWSDYYDGGCPAPPCFTGYIGDVLGARVSPLLQRLDTQSLLLGEIHTQRPDVLWDGTRWVIAWKNVRDKALEYRTMRTNAAVSGVTKVAGVTAEAPRLSRVPGGAAVVADDGTVVFLRDGTETVTRLGINAPHALATAGSRLVYVQPFPRDEMPYHGASRLHVRIGDVVPPGPKPSAPQITRATHPAGGAAMIVEWSAPPEPVNGYRVEYRVDDGLWNELDFWFDARARQLVIRPWRTGAVRYQFRVRAVNDAGFSLYSNAATVRTRKTRAVR